MLIIWCIYFLVNVIKKFLRIGLFINYFVYVEYVGLIIENVYFYVVDWNNVKVFIKEF